MNNYKINLSIGIPAYNEEANIKSLIETLLLQKGNNFEIKEILIISDNSKDNTIKQVKEIEDNRIKLIVNTKRLGLALTQNIIIDRFVGDVLFITNADVLLTENFIEEAIKPFYKYPNLSLVGVRILPLDARNLFEKIINYAFKNRQSMYESWNTGDNLYLCRGTGRLFSRKFAKSIKWPRIISEDTYSYLLNKINNNKFVYIKKAVLYFRSPNSLRDHELQSKRFQLGPIEMYNYFPKVFVDKHYEIPKKNVIKFLITFLIDNPVFFLFYLCIYFHSRLKNFKYLETSPLWVSSTSSKILKTGD